MRLPFPIRRCSTSCAAACLFSVLVLLAPALRAQRGNAPPPSDVPPVSMTCPMHPDVVESSAGNCPICKMNLVPVRLESIWTCPVHAVISEGKPGTCPICRRDLIQMTVALTWTCTDRADINQIDRGTCPDGKPMIAKRTLRPHGNHNPQHGGQFFMAPDNFHHLEGAYPRNRVFRLYLYDDYARPLASDQVKRIKGKVVTKETFDSVTGTTKEIAVFPLAVASNGAYLEARVDSATLPAQMAAKIRFKDDAPEYRFDFTFSSLSQQPTPATVTASGSSVNNGRSTGPGAARRPAQETPKAAPVSAAAAPPPNIPPAADVVASGVDSTAATAIPDTPAGIIAELRTRNQQIGELVQRGDFGAVWVPAFQAKDLAIALETHAKDLDASKRDAATPSIARLVRTAWLLDAFGDLGNRQQIVDAYAVFSSAVSDVVTAFAPNK
jgi:Heavy metal binding domain